MMKKIIFCALALVMAAGAAHGQKKTVAVVPTLGSAVSNDVRGAVQDALEEGVTNSEHYTLVAREGGGYEQALKEVEFQQKSGAVGDEQLTEFGKAIRADFVCYATLRKVGANYRIAYRLVNVGLLKVDKFNSKSTKNGEDDLLDIINDIAQELFGDSGGGSFPNTQLQPLEMNIVTEIPAWFLTPRNGLYVGVSLPFEDEAIAKQQAIYAALLRYMLQHDCEGTFQFVSSYLELSNGQSGTSTSAASGKISLLLPDSYEVAQLAKNRYGEVFVALRVPASAAGRVKMEVKHDAEENVSDNTATLTSKLELLCLSSERQFYFSAAEDENGVEVVAQMKPEGLYDALSPQTTYAYMATRQAERGRSDDEIRIPKSDVRHKLKQSLGMAYLMTLLDIFRQAAVANNAALTQNTQKMQSATEATKHSATAITEMYILSDFLYTNHK
jgi:hypothetical protein